LSCENDYFLTTFGSCEKICPLGYFPDNASNLCIPCPIGCHQCRSQFNCEVCQKEYYFYNGTCLKGRELPPRDSYFSPNRHYLIMIGPNGLEETRIKIQKSDSVSPCPNISEIKENPSHKLYSQSFSESLCDHPMMTAGFCDSSCLICKRDSKSCLVCPPEISNGIISGERCECPLSLPLLDREASVCVKHCPEGYLLISKTQECVPDCMKQSFLDSSTPYLFEHNGECLERCPEGYYGETTLHLETGLRCVPKQRIKLIDDQDNISLGTPQMDCFQDYLKPCKINQRLPGMSKHQFTPNKLNDLLLDVENAKKIKMILKYSQYFINIFKESKPQISKWTQCIQS